MKCNPKAFAQCPTHHLCGTSAADACFMEGSECDKFNRSVLERSGSCLITIDEDLALAFLAGAAAIEQSGKCNGLFTVGSIDQRSIPFSDAARALRRAGQHYLKMG